MDEVTILSLLLKDPEERCLLKDSPDAFRAKHVLTDSTLNYVLQLDRNQMEFQAEGLLKKRLHEIKSYAPQTLARLGDQAWELFHPWAVHNWAEGHQRHAIDTMRFLEHLKSKGTLIDSRELNCLYFEQKKKRISIHLLLPSAYTGLGLHFIWRRKQGYRDYWIHL